MSQSQSQSTTRHSEYDINPMILNRWSPRAMSGEEITDMELMRLFEGLDWHHHHTMVSHGDLFMLKEIQNIGMNSSI